MTSEERDLGWLLDVLQEARHIQELVVGLDRAALAEDWRAQYALIRCVEIIGEAARRVSETFRQQHPEIPWSGMVGMRNVLIHDYDEIDLDTVWQVATVHIPALIAQIAPLIPPDEPDSASPSQEA